jgi:LacI family transcriptional regulator
MHEKRRQVLLALSIAQQSYYKGVARYAREHEWHVVPDMIYTGKIPIGWTGDGIISFLGHRADLVEFVLSSQLPTVELSLVRADIDLPRVAADNEMIGRLAAEHFLERGFKHFAWAPFLDDVVNAERYLGFNRAVRKHDYECHALTPAHRMGGETWQMDWAGQRRRLIQEVSGLPRPLAIFGYNDCVAADLICACEDAGLLVPEEVAVIGVDNDPFICESIATPLSSVRHDLERMAYEGAALLDRLMAGKRPPRNTVRIPPRGVVTRKSSDIFAVEDLNVARGLRHIWENYHHPLLSVSDVVDATAVSRRPLEKAFRRHLRRSIHDEIIRTRLEKAKELLVSTDLTVSDISRKTGFARPNHFFRTFRRATKTSPKVFRHRQS